MYWTIHFASNYYFGALDWIKFYSLLRLREEPGQLCSSRATILLVLLSLAELRFTK